MNLSNPLLRSLQLILLCGLLSACVTSHEDSGDGLNPDLYPAYNRSTHRFNTAMDDYILKPAAEGYTAIAPWRVQKSVTNLFKNVTMPAIIVNDILQGRLYWTVSDLWRFIVNTTAGIGGLFDVASDMGLDYHYNSFGLTLTSWGFEDSSYIELPFFGPSTVADAVGLIPDYFLSPWYYLFNPYWVQYGLYTIKVVNSRASLLDKQALAEQIALDKYTFYRNAYLQTRRREQYINEHPPRAIPTYLDKENGAQE